MPAFFIIITIFFLSFSLVNLDYIYGKTDEPHGVYYDYNPKYKTISPNMEKFVEMCFDPNSKMNKRLKETILTMITEEKRDE